MSANSKRTNIRSGARWEPIVGYSRAVRIGQMVAVSGSAAVDADGALVGEGDAYLQAQQCIKVIEEALGQALQIDPYNGTLSSWTILGYKSQKHFLQLYRWWRK